MMHLRIALSPKQKQALRFLKTTPVTGYGGAKGGGKSHWLRNVWLAETLAHPGITTALFRRTYGELQDNHIGPLFKQFPELRGYYNGERHELRFPELESELKFRYCKHDSDVDIHQGQEYHRLGIEEAGQWPESMFWRLMGSNRSSREHIRPRAGLTFNPGGIGHKWLKRLFIQKDLKPHEIAAGWKKEDFAFVQALVTDNPALMKHDPQYVKKLEAEPNEALRKAFRYGDWDIQAGQYFDVRRDINVCKPFKIPGHWTRFGSYDYGFGHLAAFGWFAVDTDGNVYMYRELLKARTRVEDFAALCNKFEDTKHIKPIWAGLDCWAQRNTAVGQELKQPTVAEEFAKHKIFLKPANIDRKQGARRLRDYLSPFTDAQNIVRSKLTFFDNCQLSFDCISRMIHDPDDIEDVLKVDSVDGDPDTGDDAYDMVRYGIMSRPSIAKVPDPRQRDTYDSQNPNLNRATWQTA